MLKLLKDSENVKATLHDRFQRILIDEYQDTNQIQKELIQTLTGPNTIVCAVGDEDQSIYGWRGARVENILEFESDFPNAQIIKLEQNYRSTQRILLAANSVISKNVGRRGKELWTENPMGTAVSFYLAEDDHSEARHVLDGIEKLLATGSYSAKDISIFYRTHVQSRVLEDECRRRNRNYRIIGGIRFYDRAEIKNATAFLKLALNPSDNVSFGRIINTPSKGIGAKTLERLALVSGQMGTSMLESIPRLTGRSKAENALREFYAWFWPIRQEIENADPADITERILTESKYIESLEKEDTVEAEARIENLEELLRSMKEFREETDGNLVEFLDRVSLLSDLDSYNESEESITLMTVHNSKGLEYDAVFLVGMEEGIFPHQRSIEDGDPDEIEEERRLCYVGMTRARKQLFLTAAHRRRLYHSTQYNPVARFISEIPVEHIVMTHDQGLGGSSQRQKPKRKFQNYDEYRQESYDEDDYGSLSTWDADQGERSESPYMPGMKVKHPDFGAGTIRKCEGSPNNVKLTIFFDRGGVKKLMANYCTLEKLDS